MMESIDIGPDWKKQDLPEKIRAFMEKWSEIAAEENRSYTFKWPAKLVKTTFVYENKQYCIYPETFGVPQDLMERIQGRLDKDLNELGCKDVFSYGFLD